MNRDADRQRRIFFEVHRDLPREGPGSRASTARALRLILEREPASAIRTVLDVACGPGQQTVDLVGLLPAARLLALDLHPPFLVQARQRLESVGAADRVALVRADMRRLPVRGSSIDLVWCEGAAYIMGIGAALDAWHGLLRSGGFCAFTEAVWLRRSVPGPVRRCWAEYPAMGDRGNCRRLVVERGFEPIGDFVLPAAAWWDDYYTPMEARIAALRARYQDDAVAAAVLDECAAEIDVCRRYGDCYGYAFFVARKGAGDG